MFDTEKWRSYYGDQPGGIIWPYPNGDRFRSKTEAHWAVFFDALGIKYEYEPQWFNGGLNYRPDFLLPVEQGRNIWVEIKPPRPITKMEREKAYNLAFKTKANVLIFRGYPWDFQGESYHWVRVLDRCESCGYIGHRFSYQCPNCGIDELIQTWPDWEVIWLHTPVGWDVYNGKNIIFEFKDDDEQKKRMQVKIDEMLNDVEIDPYKYTPSILRHYKIDITQALYISRTTHFDYWIRN